MFLKQNLIKQPKLLAIALAAFFLQACGGSQGSGSVSPPTPEVRFSSTGADGWASTAGGTNGGANADAAHIFNVSTRSDFIKALYGSSVVIAADGSFSGATKDNTPKIIYLNGTINLNTDASGKELTADDYLNRGNCLVTLQATQPTINNWSQLFAQYILTYAPNTWNTTLTAGRPNALTGDLETARACAATQQGKVVKIDVGSNTSIIGVGSSAKITRGNLVLDGGVENIVIRNITFEDAFDFFPTWDPTDSFPTVPSSTSTTSCSTSAPTKCVGGRWNSLYDNISILKAQRVWIDHNTFSDGSNPDKNFPPIASWDFGGNPQLPEQKVQHHDGLVDVTKGANLITLSYNHFKQHDKTGLIGSTDTTLATEHEPGLLSVTLHHNLYEDNKQRQPRVRFGKVHIYNNYYLNNGNPDYTMSTVWTAGTASKIYAENNVIETVGAPSSTVAIVAGVSSSASNFRRCVTAKSSEGVVFSGLECGTYFYANNTLLNGNLVDVTSSVLALSTASTSNQPITTLTAAVWSPAQNYGYTLDSVAIVKSEVMAKAGAGRAATTNAMNISALQPSNINRPQLSAALASEQTILKTLAKGGTVGGVITDNWDPTLGAGDVGSFVANYVVDPSATASTTIFGSLQAAINAAVTAGGTQRVFIEIKPGTYTEQVCIRNAPPITLYSTSADAAATVITFNAWNGLAKPAATVLNACEGRAGQPTYGTSGSSTLFGYSDGLHLKNLTIANGFNETSTTASAVQAVAFTSRGDKIIVDNVRFLGNQDTLQPSTSNATTFARSYYKNCYVEGDVDYVFGRGIAVFDACEFKSLTSRSSTGYIFAPAHPQSHEYGFFITNSSFTTNGTATASLNLGRAWDDSSTFHTTTTSLTGCLEDTLGSGIYTCLPNGITVVRDSVIGAHISKIRPWGAAASTNRPYNAALPFRLSADIGGTSVHVGKIFQKNRLVEFNNTGAGAGL